MSTSRGNKFVDLYGEFARRADDESDGVEADDSTSVMSHKSSTSHKSSASSTSSARRAEAAVRRAELEAEINKKKLALEARRRADEREIEENYIKIEEMVLKAKMDYEDEIIKEEDNKSSNSSRRGKQSRMDDARDSATQIASKRNQVTFQLEQSEPASVVTSTPVQQVHKDIRPSQLMFNPAAPSFTPAGSSFSPPSALDPTTAVLGLSAAADVTASLQQCLNATMEQVKLGKIPPLKLPVFNGDITEFSAFRRSFKHNIENNVDDSSTRLSQLLAHLGPNPAELIACCEHMEPDIGYPIAWNLLEEKYCRDYELTESFIQKLLSWKSIKEADVAELERYANYLRKVAAALKPNYVRLEGMDTMCALASKLPPYLQRKWGNKLGKKDVSFPAFIEFVHTEVKGAEWCSRIAAAGKTAPLKSKERSDAGSARALTLAATHPISGGEASKERGACVCCEKSGHYLHRCHKFISLKTEDRWTLVINNKLCYRCLRKGHSHGDDCPLVHLKCSVCGAGSHNTLLHSDFSKERADVGGGEKRAAKTGDKVEVARAGATSGDKPPEDSKSEGLPPVLPVSSISDHRPDGRVMLKIVPVRVNGKIDTFAFLDGGAASCLASKRLIDRLGVVGETVNQTMRTENGDFQCHEKVALSIQSTNGSESTLVDTVYVTGHLSVTTKHMMPHRWISRWDHLRDIDLPPAPKGVRDVELIIGLNTPLCRLVLDQRHGGVNEPSAYLTPLGWVVFGPTDITDDDVLPLHHVRPVDEITEILQNQYQRDFWEKDAYCKRENSIEDNLFLEKVSSSIQFDDGKYTVSLPFRSTEPIILPDNREAAEQRMRCLKRKFERDEKLKSDYISSIEGNLRKGYAEPVPQSELNRNDGMVWRVPHHGVKHPTKDKRRVVFDLKSTFLGTSPNDHLLQGPDLTNSLLGTLLRFRFGEYAVTADIQEMFMQVRVPRSERDYFRFLWWIDGDTSQPLYECRMCSHPFGARSSPGCVNFALLKTAEDHGNQFGDEAVRTIQRNFYVDNMLKAMDDESTCIELVRNVRLLCSAGGWRLNQWTSNSKTVLESIPASEIDASIASLDLNKDELPIERALGIHWSMSEDSFFFKLSLKEKPATRRGMLSLACSMYDPLGFISPVIVVSKMLLQSLCRDKLGWDEPIGEDEEAKWNTWLQDLPKLIQHRIRRNIAPPSFGKVIAWQLHHFADASQVGYGVVTYMRITNAKGDVHCTLIMSRARVAPLQGSTIPRLELTAALLAAQIDFKLREELDVELQPSIFWTDSTTVLKYLNNERARYHTFVANRVRLIRELTSVLAWRYVDTASNPADLASRGMKVDDFLSSDLWMSGPTFLGQDETEWPLLPDDVKIADLKGDAEVKTEAIICEAVTLEMSGIEKLVASTSCWNKLLRRICWLKRVIRIFKNRIARKKGLQMEQCHAGPLTLSEIRAAEKVVFTATQERYYHSELETLRRNGIVKPSSSLLRLQPFVKDGLLRVGGRLSQADLCEDARHPIILPPDSDAVRLLVRNLHENYAHCGQNFLMSVLRSKYWIVRGNRAVRSIVRNCAKCKIIAAKPMEQQMAELPLERTGAGRPFECTGADCFGPFLVRVGKSEVKRWGIVFTCMASRAVHIEVLSTMETDSFVNALRRFVCRRGSVKKIMSDNGSNLVGAESAPRRISTTQRGDDRQQHAAEGS